MILANLFRVAKGGAGVATPTSVYIDGATFGFDRPIEAVIDSTMLTAYVKAAPGLTCIQDLPSCEYLVASNDGKSYARNGLMIDPYLPQNPYTQPATRPPQGYMGLLATSGAGLDAASQTDYDDRLNSSPTKPTAPAGVSFGQAANGGIDCSIVKTLYKAISWPGMQNWPTQWPHFQEFVPCHIVAELPSGPNVIFPPSPFCTGVKRTDILLSYANKNVLGTGLGYVTGQPTLQECINGQYMFSPNQPFMANYGESMRRFVYSPKRGPTYNGYARDIAIDWADVGLAMLSEGAAGTPNDIFYRMVKIGLDQFAHYDRGYRAFPGAGQSAGYWPPMFLAAMALYDFDPTLITKVLQYQANENFQQKWNTAVHVNCNPYFGPPSNHEFQRRTGTDEDVGRPSGDLGFKEKPPGPNQNYDSQDDFDYGLEAIAVAAIPGQMFCALLTRSDGKKGAEIIGKGTDIQDTTNPDIAIFAYQDLVRTYVDYTKNGVIPGGSIYKVGGSIMLERHQRFYDAHRTKYGIPKWVGTPSGSTPHFSKTIAYGILTPISGGFSWDLSLLGGNTLPVDGYRLRYYIDGIQSFDVDTPGVTGQQLGLNPNLDHDIQWSRASTVNGVLTWGPWSSIDKRQSTDTGWPCRLKPLGTDNSAPVCTVPPKLRARKYSNWEGKGEFKDCIGPYDWWNDLNVFPGSGYWQGLLTNTDIVSKVQRSGADVATGMYTLTGTDCGLNLRATATVGATVANGSNVAIQAIPTDASTAIINIPSGQMKPGVKLKYPAFWASLVANSVQTSGSVIALPVEIDTVSFYLSDGSIAAPRIRAIKGGQQNRMRGDLAADKALTQGVTYYFEFEFQVGIRHPENGKDATIDWVWKIGSALGEGSPQSSGSDYMTPVNFWKAITRDVTQAFKKTVSGTFTTTSSHVTVADSLIHFWLYYANHTGTGSTTGGDLAISSIILKVNGT